MEQRSEEGVGLRLFITPTLHYFITPLLDAPWLTSFILTEKGPSPFPGNFWSADLRWHRRVRRIPAAWRAERSSDGRALPPAPARANRPRHSPEHW